ncbi:MAG: C40 family peptidase [Armatimonadetes bacterium]|nr:C40 family peptidase [Armatimonadota bacterium]
MLSLVLATTLGSAVVSASPERTQPIPQPTPAATQSYTVEKGDNDWTIAKKFNTTVEEIREMNPKVDWTKLKVGAKIQVPKAVAARNSRNSTPAASRSTSTKTAKITKTDVIVRKGPGTSFDKVTMVTKGKTADIIESRDGWHKLKFSGGTIGWVRKDMLEVSTKSTALPQTPDAKSGNDKKTELPVVVKNDDKEVIITGNADPASTVSSSIPKSAANAPKPANAAPALPAPNGSKVDSLLETAFAQRGVRYVWGGTSRSGFDCSGFVYYVFQKHGMTIPRTSISQSQYGLKVDRSSLQAGDLIFFKTTRANRVSHVGIYIGNGKFIHASSGGGKVQVNSLVSDSYYKTRYVGARRMPGLTGKVRTEFTEAKLDSLAKENEEIRAEAEETERNSVDKVRQGTDVTGR